MEVTETNFHQDQLRQTLLCKNCKTGIEVTLECVDSLRPLGATLFLF